MKDTIPIIKEFLVRYQDQLMALTDEIAANRHEDWPSGMRVEPIDKRMAVVKAKISLCEELLRRLA